MTEDFIKTLFTSALCNYFYDLLSKSYTAKYNCIDNVIRYQTRQCTVYSATNKNILIIYKSGKLKEQFKKYLTQDISYKPLQLSKIQKPIIMIILESPHTNEFNHNKPQPAAGKSGENIHNNLSTLLTKLQEKLLTHFQKTYEIAIINPVPYQTSMGIEPINTNVRDVIWVNFWNDASLALQQKFTDLLRSLPNQSIIINACTGGNKSKSLKLIIDDHIKNVFKPTSNKQIQYGLLDHPSSPSYNSSINNLMLIQL